MLERLEEIIYQVTGKNNLNLTDDTDFVKDLELNSFDVMNIISALEDLYDVDIPTRDVWQLRQVKDAVEYLKAKGVEEQ
ncbi:acyl carrier protein [Lachnotalea sp. AF33-28]|uniref:acyl carrier protein n=1 Tax=Lachnotalea sp. AF33-28 TaxID=2292046 RepID=UPI000E4E83D4|nr:phosphopantetheine-binding protein [Lachnotalea sp. AF33-28]RHP34370.1 acyl carrier protein [Lachnotalea sp. AF33-28]